MVSHFGHDSFRVRAPMRARHAVPKNPLVAMYPSHLPSFPASVPFALRRACGESLLSTTDHGALPAAHHSATPLECAVPRFSALSPLECAFTKGAPRNPFRMRTYKKRWGWGSEDLTYRLKLTTYRSKQFRPECA